MLSKRAFYILSFTWGLPLVLAGLTIAAVLILLGKKPKKYGWCWYFELGENWGGCELGLIFITCRQGGEHIKAHEFGHAIQNCRYGFLMPFLVNMPSTLRYWQRRIFTALGLKLKTDYDDIWFEGQATQLGKAYIAEIRKGSENC